MTSLRDILCHLPQAGMKEKSAGLDRADGNDTGRWIAKNVPSLREEFKLSPWLSGGNLQTLWNVFSGSPFEVEYERVHLRVPDGGTIGLDFTPPNHADLPADAPIVVVCHGITGGSHESYVKEVLAEVTGAKEDGGLGARGVVLNFRGCAGTPVTSPQLYSLGTTIDLSLALHYLRAHYPTAQIHGIGFSLGAAVLTRYLADTGDSSLLSSGTALGCPWNIRTMVDGRRSNPPSRLLYTRIVAQLMLCIFCAVYALNPAMWDESGLDVRKLKRMRRWWWFGPGAGATMKEVENVLAAKVGGPRGDGLWPFKDSGEMYEWACPTDALQDIRRSLLAINAYDDPLIDGHAIPIEAFRRASHAFVAITPGGGHLGWMTSVRGSYHYGRPVSRRWFTRPISELLRAAERDFSPCGTVRLDMVSRDGQQWEVVSKGGHAIQGGGEVGWTVVDLARSW